MVSGSHRNQTSRTTGVSLQLFVGTVVVIMVSSLNAPHAPPHRPGGHSEDMQTFSFAPSRRAVRSERVLPRFEDEMVYLCALAYQCHTYAMARSRVSTTVDENLLSEARTSNPGQNDAALFDAALGALLARSRATAIDNEYKAYDAHPIDEPDEWGDLQSFRSAAAAT